MACNPDCQKIIIDTGMGREAAELYASVVDKMDNPLHAATARFYGAVVTLTERVAQAILHSLDSDQLRRMMEQIDKACYRADWLIAWAQEDPQMTIATRADDWTNQLFAWAKDDQNFYTALIKEVGDKKS